MTPRVAPPGARAPHEPPAPPDAGSGRPPDVVSRDPSHGGAGEPPRGPGGDHGGTGGGGRSRVILTVAAVALIIAIALGGFFVLLVLPDDGTGPQRAAKPTAAHHMGSMHAPKAQAPAAGATAEPFRRVDPNLPAVPAGKVKRFHVAVYEHVTQVSPDLPPTRVWSYAVNGVLHRGTGVSEPMVVNHGDEVQITLDNGLRRAMTVQHPHSIDLHSAEVAPDRDYRTIQPGRSLTFRFRADHPGVFMYHCATAPVLMHAAAGMVGMMVVKPRDLAPVDRELWITQQEYYPGPRPGDGVDFAKAQAKQPDVIAFNGYANQYQQHPIAVQPGERIRMYVLNAGPSSWSAFHVIGSIFDRTVVEGVAGRDAQTISLAPSQGGWVEFTLDHRGSYPFVDHSFADLGKGAAGAFAAGIPAKPGMGH